MPKPFTNEARRILELAAQEARKLGHHYVGTEHILLALAEHDTATADVLRTFGVDATIVRQGIETLVHPGPAGTLPRQLPLTPRARRVIDFAQQEALLQNQNDIGTEHLLLGLIRETDGVAGQVLRELGLTAGELRSEVFKIRLMQARLVERAVRPVRVPTARKRRMREELLGHLTCIYEQELSQRKDAAVAMREAAARFGDPAELARDFNRAITRTDRIGYFLERRFGWRAPESATRYLARQAIQSFALIAVIVGVGAGIDLLAAGWNPASWQSPARVALALLLLVPLDQFLLGYSYYKLRDSLWGAFGSRRSLARAVLMDLLIFVIVLGSGLGLVAWISGPAAAIADLWAISGAATVAAAGYLLAGYLRGAAEIRDALWACLDLDHSSTNRPDDPATSPG